MTSAATTPTATDGPGLARSEFVIDAPPSETCTSGPSAVCAAVMRAAASAAVIWSGCLSQVTRAKATVPSLLTWAAPAAAYGLATDAMPGSAETWARAAVTAAAHLRGLDGRAAGGLDDDLVGLAGGGSGSAAVSRLTAAWESVPGRLRSELKAPPGRAGGAERDDQEQQPGGKDESAGA